MTLFTYLVLHLLAQAAVEASSDWVFDFANQGYDFGKAIPPDGWTGINRCGEASNQSPINLFSPLGVYGWAYGAVLPHEVENMYTHYLNPKPGSSIVYERKNYKVFLNELDPIHGDERSYINTELLSQLFDSKTTQFEPTSFHVHHPTEHPINGKRHDVALHLVHMVKDPHPEETQVALDIAIQFSVEDYDQDVSEEELLVLSNFWDSMGWDGFDDEILGLKQQILFQDLMAVMDLDQKWVYSGSFAFPPCAKQLGWYVIRKVYPIEYKHMFMIRQVFLDHRDELKATTNIRGIFPINGHDVHSVGGLRIASSLALALLPTLVMFL